MTIFKSLIIALFVLGVVQIANRVRSKMISNLYITSSIPGSNNANMMFEQINNSLHSNDIVLCNKPRVVYYYSKRKSFLVNQKNLGLSMIYPKIYVLSINKNGEINEINKFLLKNNKKNFRQLAVHGELKLFEIF